MSCRLLYLVGQLGSGGMERQLYYLLHAMDRERYQPAVAVWNFSEQDVYTPRIRALGVPLYTLSGTSSAVAKLSALRRLVKQLSPTIVHSLTFYLNIMAHSSVQGTAAIACGSLRGDFTEDVKSTGWWLSRLSARWPRHQIYNSFTAAENARCTRRFFVPRQVTVIRNGLDFRRFCVAPLSLTGRASILGVGSLLSIKRWDRLLSAAHTLKLRGLDFLIRIAGDGPLRESLKRQAQSLGLTNYVTFHGHVDDVPSLLSEATVVVHPSDTEGCPNVVMEAMACGRPVVATNVGDVPFLIEDGKTGFVVCRGDEAMFIERMMTLITNRNLCRSMGEAGRAKAEREFGLDRLVAETLAAYRAAGWRDA